jgi:hypothetical protein
MPAEEPVRKPRRLRAGDLVGVVSPASSRENRSEILRLRISRTLPRRDLEVVATPGLAAITAAVAAKDERAALGDPRRRPSIIERGGLMGFDPADVNPVDGLAPLPIEQVAALLAASAIHIGAELDALGDEGARWRPAPGEWSANEALGHIIEADRRGFAGRIRRILETDGVEEIGWDQIAVAAERRDQERTVASIVDEFSTGRTAGIELVRSLRDEDLERHAIHDAVGRVTVRNLLHEWVFHDRNHIRQILANGQARAWPAMGNARRFSHPDR